MLIKALELSGCGENPTGPKLPDFTLSKADKSDIVTVKKYRIFYHVVDLIIMDTSTCLLRFFLDFLVTMPVSLFLGRPSFLGGPFLPS